MDALLIMSSFYAFSARNAREVDLSDRLLTRPKTEFVLNMVPATQPIVTTCTTSINIKKLCILSKQCICVFRMVLTINSINRLGFVVET
jgi:hypothetical protein